MADLQTLLNTFLASLYTGVMGSADVTQIRLLDGTTAPTATVGVAKIFIDVADGDLKIIYGDGVTKVIAADT